MQWSKYLITPIQMKMLQQVEVRSLTKCSAPLKWPAVGDAMLCDCAITLKHIISSESTSSLLKIEANYTEITIC
jgi:hypothetical protein